MNKRIPSLKQLSDGRWFTKWGGHKHYFGRDRDEALELYAESLKEWKAWRARCEEARESATTPGPKGVQRPMLIQIADRFIEDKSNERGPALGRYYRKHLARLLTAYKDAWADEIGARELAALKSDMMKIGYKPKTINHDLIAAKALLQWAMDHEEIPERSLRGCKAMKLGRPPNKALSPELVRQWIWSADRPMQAWLALGYLCAARPSESVAVAHGYGQWTEPGIFELHAGKTDFQSLMSRHLVFSDEALSWLDLVEPVWSRFDSFSNAVRKVFPLCGPSLLRHSAATHLNQAGVSREETDLILGHSPGRVSLTYAHVEWQPLRTKAARLTLQAEPLSVQAKEAS